MNKLKMILKEKDRTVSFLVRQTGISRYSLDKIVKGEKSPIIEEANRIAKALSEKVGNIFLLLIQTLLKAMVLI